MAEYVFTQVLHEATVDYYDHLIQALESRYKEHRTMASYLAVLGNRRLGQKEKLTDLSAISSA